MRIQRCGPLSDTLRVIQAAEWPELHQRSFQLQKIVGLTEEFLVETGMGGWWVQLLSESGHPHLQIWQEMSGLFGGTSRDEPGGMWDLSGNILATDP